MKFFSKLVFYFVSMIHQLYYYVVNRLTSKSINLDPKSKYSISLTSYGERLNTVYLTIESLAKQVCAPVSITLWLSKEDISPEEIPRSLKRLKSRGLDIKFIDENIRSYKKLYYEYIEKKESVSFIMTADDDVFYPSWLGQLALEQASINSQSVVCFRSHLMRFTSTGDILPYTQWEKCQGTVEDRQDVFPTGVGSVLYPTGALVNLDSHRAAFLEHAPYADDVWFKACTLKNGYTSTNVGHNLEHFYCVLSKQRKGLEKVNIGEGKNDTQLKATMSYFGLTSNDFGYDD
ncbi:hypothetical protein GT360_13420 [Vibrio astriarenae]|uniref:Glycosyltransferase n=1 Tax=Vibrio astriarenae TaxID=1481923 RepID=A0A7Z2YEG8_9VIBR|nr:hypothetical protein [Vibrio astriarenae]QIA64428.1 hypothetical protein GT360_13420 [Vibrio astriarenae]